MSEAQLHGNELLATQILQKIMVACNVEPIDLSSMLEGRARQHQKEGAAVRAGQALCPRYAARL